MKVPGNWPDVEALVRDVDNPDEAWPLFQAFVRAASYHLYGKVDNADLERAEKTALRQKAAGAAVWLREHEDETTDGPYRFYLEPVMRQAWSAVLDGAVLEIPDYVAAEPPLSEKAQEEIDQLAAESFADPS